VRFLTEKMEKAGCQVWPRFIKAATCAGAAGGYSSGHGVYTLFFASLSPSFASQNKRIVAIAH
jgi:hypothetical protein